MKKIKLIALLAALVVGLGVYKVLQVITKPVETPRTAVVVAAVDIPENTKITADMVTMKDVATEALLPSHLRRIDDAVGMVMSSDVYAGEQIVSNRLVTVGMETAANDTLAYKVDEGMRAITISVGSTTGLVNMIKPGNRVDVLMNYTYKEVPEEEEEPEETAAPALTPVYSEEGEILYYASPDEPATEAEEPEEETVNATRYLLQNVPVLAVGSVMNKNGAEEYSTVTLQVTPEDAAKLSFAEWTSSLRLVMRSSLDNEIVEEEEITLDILRGIEEETEEEAEQ